MIITFPHLGPMEYVMSIFLNELGIEHVVPPENDRKTLQTGIELSPEEMCLPFKYMVGNLKRAYDLGADTAVMAATCGPCRLGEYCQLMMESIKEAGCSYRWILLDSPADIGLREFLRRVSAVTGGKAISRRKMAETVICSLRMTFDMDRLRRKIEKKAGYLQRPYEAVELMHEIRRKLKGAGTFRECRHVMENAEKRLADLSERKEADPVKILVTGEIYTSIEPAANGRLSERLMLLGCSVTRHMSLSWWLKHTLIDAIVPKKIYDICDAKGGIPCNMGGYGRQTVSKILRSDEFDGIIKIMPSGCMPEIVAKAFCENITKDGERRILHLIYDELSGDAGYQTRTEAFVDMLERRRNVLDGNRHRLYKH